MIKSSEFDMRNYLRIKSSTLSSRELVVRIAILMGLIFVKSAINYTGGNLSGTALSAIESATTVQVFMISSMFSNNTEIVRLIKTQTMTEDDLKATLLQTIQCVQAG